MAIEASLTMPARVKTFFVNFCSLFSFFGHTIPFTSKSGLPCCIKTLLRRPRLVRNLSIGFSPTQTSHRSKTSTMITSSNSLCRERDAQSLARCATSHHASLRAVPRTNRTRTKANSHNRSATSSTNESPACDPSLLSLCSYAAASPGVCTDAASAG